MEKLRVTLYFDTVYAATRLEASYYFPICHDRSVSGFERPSNKRGKRQEKYTVVRMSHGVDESK